LTPEPFYQTYFAALDDDLDTPKALVQIGALSGAILEAAASGYDVSGAQSALRAMAHVFGFWAAA
jgi:cysteinyl-tRNA synthetase (EC 6.1.1.16)